MQNQHVVKILGKFLPGEFPETNSPDQIPPGEFPLVNLPR